MYTEVRLDYRLRLWTRTSASRAVSAVAELLVCSRTAQCGFFLGSCDGFSCIIVLDYFITMQISLTLRPILTLNETALDLSAAHIGSPDVKLEMLSRRAALSGNTAL